jgi:hypothetical protein
MKLQSVTDKAFLKFGEVLEGYDFKKLLKVLEDTTPAPDAGVVYIPSDPKLEALPIFAQLRDRAFGGIPIQIGYVNGTNTVMNCLEWHRGSEVCVATEDVIMLLAHRQDIEDWKIDSSKVQAFLLPKGTGILYYETSMHYAPAKKDGAYRAIIVLPKDTNTDLPKIKAGNAEDKLLRARNKWLIAHKDAPEAKGKGGAHIGITGKNIDVTKDVK